MGNQQLLFLTNIALSLKSNRYELIIHYYMGGAQLNLVNIMTFSRYKYTY